MAVGIGGCAVNPKPAFQDVDNTVFERTGHRIHWNQNTSEDQQATKAVDDLLARELTVNSAVEIALLNNHELQATFERIGIAQADLVQAGLLHNPQFSASWRFPDRPPRDTDAEYSVSGEFLDLLILPLKKKIAKAELERTKQMVADEVITHAAEVQTSFYSVQAEQQLLDRLKLIDEVNRTASELAHRQQTAGTLNDLDLANQDALAGQSKLDVLQAELELKSQREKLSRLLGLRSDANYWTIQQNLPDIPDTEVSLENIETTALAERLDLAAARAEVESLARSLGLTKDFRYLTTLRIGVDTEHNPDRSNVTGPRIDLELPIFDQGQARIATATGQYRQARQEFLQREVIVCSEVREAREKLLAERELVNFYGKTLLPQRINIVNQTQLHYNAMLKGTYDLLLAKQNEVDTERNYIAAWRDYWIARVELQRAVGGKLPLPPATAPTTAPSAPPTTAPDTQPKVEMNMKNMDMKDMNMKMESK